MKFERAISFCHRLRNALRRHAGFGQIQPDEEQIGTAVVLRPITMPSAKCLFSQWHRGAIVFPSGIYPVRITSGEFRQKLNSPRGRPFGRKLDRLTVDIGAALVGTVDDEIPCRQQVNAFRHTLSSRAIERAVGWSVVQISIPMPTDSPRSGWKAPCNRLCLGFGTVTVHHK